MKVVKAQICNVSYSPVGKLAYYEATDEGRLGFAKHLDDIQSHLAENQQLVLTLVEMSEQEYAELGTSTSWWQIWEG